nr:GntR family transcriptional regulator [Chelatococcus sp. YT9]
MKRKPKFVGYRQIVAILVGEIQSGVWTLDSSFPTEMELVERFGVGRNTVREALRELQDLGYIKRRRGARSVLTTTNPENTFINSVRSVEELLDYAKNTKATVLTTETVRVDEGLARRLDIAPGGEWVRLGLLRSRDGQSAPFSYSEVYVLPKFADVIEYFGAESELFRVIENRHGLIIRRVEQQIEATLVDANIASRLNVQIGSASLLVRSKFYSSEGELVEIGIVNFPASRYKLQIALDRRGRVS